MLHHLSLAVSDIARSDAFYQAVLGALGYVRVWGHETAVGYGVPGGDDKFAIKLARSAVQVPGNGFHIAFAAQDRAAVGRFYAAALAHGGRDNGLPGLRPQYGEGYYAAFVLDPDGWEIEAVVNGQG